VAVGYLAWPGLERTPPSDRFEYLEEVTFAHVGEPFLASIQKSRDASDDGPVRSPVELV
jgi:hypothetical protein